MTDRQAEMPNTIEHVSHPALNTERPDAAWIASRRIRRFVMTDEERRTRRDWGLYVMVFYGVIALTFGGFAVVAVTQDPGRPNMIASRAGGSVSQPTTTSSLSSGQVPRRLEK